MYFCVSRCLIQRRLVNITHKMYRTVIVIQWQFTEVIVDEWRLFFLIKYIVLSLLYGFMWFYIKFIRITISVRQWNNDRIPIKTDLPLLGPATINWKKPKLHKLFGEISFKDLFCKRTSVLNLNLLNPRRGSTEYLLRSAHVLPKCLSYDEYYKHDKW
jgi:hypothetical protein